jgi:hypothetical protein
MIRRRTENSGLAFLEQFETRADDFASRAITSTADLFGDQTLDLGA